MPPARARTRLRRAVMRCAPHKNATPAPWPRSSLQPGGPSRALAAATWTPPPEQISGGCTAPLPRCSTSAFPPPRRVQLAAACSAARSAGCQFPAGRTGRAPAPCAAAAPRHRWAVGSAMRLRGALRATPRSSQAPQCAPSSAFGLRPTRLTRARAPRPRRAACAPCGGAPSRCCTRRRVAAARRAPQQRRRRGWARNSGAPHARVCARRRADAPSRAAAQTGMASESVHVDFEAFQVRPAPCARVRPWRATSGPAARRGRSGAAGCRPAGACMPRQRAAC